MRTSTKSTICLSIVYFAGVAGGMAFTHPQYVLPIGVAASLACLVASMINTSIIDGGSA